MLTSLRRTLALFALPTVVVAGVLAGPAAAATSTPQPVSGGTLTAAPNVSTQGIIMRDGGICNPRWGC